MSTGTRRRRIMRARRRAQVNPVKPLPTITMEVTVPSVGVHPRRVVSPVPSRYPVAAKDVGWEGFLTSGLATEGFGLCG